MEMKFNQIATVLNSVVEQATGSKSIVATDTGSFVSQAQAALLTGLDPINNAISQVLSKTIFSIRPYNGKFRGMAVDAEKYGNHVRKINYLDSKWTNDDRISNDFFDQYEPQKIKPVQTNIYGQSLYQKGYTIYKDQFDAAFEGPEQFARFVTGIVTNCSDTLEQSREELRRATLANLIAAKIDMQKNYPTEIHQIKLVTEWCKEIGIEPLVNPNEIFKRENFGDFARWAVAKINTISTRMTSRSRLYEVPISVVGRLEYGFVNRHTPKPMQKLFVSAEYMEKFRTQVLSTTFNEKFAELGVTEEVAYFQSIDKPNSINLTASFLDRTRDFAESKTAEPVVNDHVLGVLIDEEAAGVTNVNQWIMPTPFNARGGYTTWWIHETQRHWNDLTEKAVVFTLD